MGLESSVETKGGHGMSIITFEASRRCGKSSLLEAMIKEMLKRGEIVCELKPDGTSRLLKLEDFYDVKEYDEDDGER